MIWRWTRLAFVALVLGLTAVVIWISAGGTTPSRAGALRWRDTLSTPGRWRVETGRVVWTADGVIVQPAGAHPAVVLTEAPAHGYTFEVQARPESGDTRYGLTLDWSTESSFSALVNGNGFAQVFLLSGNTRHDAFRLAQWPWIRPGTQANRIRVDVNTTHIDVRVNGEFLVNAPRGPLAPTLGLWADGPVLFIEAALWAD